MRAIHIGLSICGCILISGWLLNAWSGSVWPFEEVSYDIVDLSEERFIGAPAIKRKAFVASLMIWGIGILGILFVFARYLKFPKEHTLKPNRRMRRLNAKRGKKRKK